MIDCNAHGGDRHLVKCILDVSVRVFLDEINIWIGRLNKVSWLYWPLNWSQPHPIQNLNRIKRLCKKQLLLPDWTRTMGFPGGSDGKESTCNEGKLVSIPGLGRSPGEGHGNPLQYSCLENSMARGASWAKWFWIPLLMVDFATKSADLTFE